MKAKPYKLVPREGWVETSKEEATHLKLSLPGPVGELHLPVQIKGTRAGTGNWSWNGDVEKPTLKPSIITHSGHFVQGFDPAKDSCWCKFYAEHPEKESKGRAQCYCCHVWINDGIVQFLPDCSHELKNQQVPLLDL